jgi:putative addiction module killer protein
MPERTDSYLELVEYENARNQRPHAEWLASLDPSTAARVTIYLRRLESGNTSNVKSVGDGVFELRMDFGPGCRVYFGRVGSRIVLLLAGGTKRRQSADIARAKACWQDFHDRSKRGLHAVEP